MIPARQTVSAITACALVFLSAAALACGGDEPAAGCVSSAECESGWLCIDRTCTPGAADTGTVDAGADADAALPCGPGEVRAGGACIDECANPAATSCDAGTECDYASGACVPEGTPGILTGEGERCGDDGPLCLPGSECALTGECVAAPPCAALSCDDDGTCWGRSCLSERPAGVCAPTSLSRMNMDDFLRGGDGGAFDLEFDDACNAYIVTMISGADYLRQLTPAGELSVWTGVTNLNMGEVAVLRRPGGEFGVGEGLGEVALSYICCATCGCVSSDPQGVARLDREGAESLPMVVLATPSPGTGPWGVPTVDTGPYGLTWGRDNRLYVGNVAGQGDLVRADLEAGTSEEIHQLPARIHASATFDPSSLLVAVSGGDIFRVHVDEPLQAAWASVGEDVTSLVRDPFTGNVYVSVASARILVFGPSGDVMGELADTGEKGRMAYAPDGYLYHLVVGWPTRAEVSRYALPATR